MKLVIAFGLISGALDAVAAAGSQNAELPGCGEANIFYTGLPAYHPLVVQQGWDAGFVDSSIKNDTKNMMEGGYNVAVILAGPEEPLDSLASHMEGVHWHGTGVGYGLRGAAIPELTVLLEDVLQLFRDKAPSAPFLFNYNPNSFLWSAQRRVPLRSDCAGRPGKLLGYKEICGELCPKQSESLDHAHDEL